MPWPFWGTMAKPTICQYAPGWNRYEDELDGSNKNLLTLPLEEIMLYPALSTVTGLDVSRNCIKKLPLQFCEVFSRLQKVDLSENSLTCLPDNFGTLANLKFLDCRHNQIRSLPKSFGELSNLTWLDLKQNPLNSSLRRVIAGIPDWTPDACKDVALAIVKTVQELPAEDNTKYLRQLFAAVGTSADTNKKLLPPVERYLKVTSDQSMIQRESPGSSKLIRPPASSSALEEFPIQCLSGSVESQSGCTRSGSVAQDKKSTKSLRKVVSYPTTQRLLQIKFPGTVDALDSVFFDSQHQLASSSCATAKMKLHNCVGGKTGQPIKVIFKPGEQSQEVPTIVEDISFNSSHLVSSTSSLLSLGPSEQFPTDLPNVDVNHYAARLSANYAAKPIPSNYRLRRHPFTECVRIEDDWPVQGSSDAVSALTSVAGEVAQYELRREDSSVLSIGSTELLPGVPGISMEEYLTRLRASLARKDAAKLTPEGRARILNSILPPGFGCLKESRLRPYIDSSSNSSSVQVLFNARELKNEVSQDPEPADGAQGSPTEASTDTEHDDSASTSQSQSPPDAGGSSGAGSRQSES